MRLSNRLALTLALAAMSTSVLATSGYIPDKNSFYVAADAGIFQAAFNSSYLDQTDTIPQNIAETFNQNGYTGGLAIGYTRLVCHRYLLGAELSGNYDSHTANYQAGAASAAFSDVVNVDNHFDLTFVPGILLNNTTAAFLKIGVSRASLRDSLVSPVGFTPTMTRFNSNNNVNGFVAGLKLEKFLLDKVTVFVEGDYRDYGTVNFSSFQNYTATYTNASHVYTYDALLGVAYHLDI